MKFYTYTNIEGVKLGNSTAPLYSWHHIFDEPYVTIDDDGYVKSINGLNILCSKYAGGFFLKLQLTKKEIEQYFTEVSDPGNKVISNIRYVVSSLDCPSSTHYCVVDAIRDCEIKNIKHRGCFEVLVEYDYKWQ